MAKYRVWSGGDGTGGADNTNWTQAYQTLAAALAVPPVSGDAILIQYTSQETSAANVTWTVPAGVDIHCVDKDASEALTSMGTSGWIGGNTAFYHTLTGGGAHLVTGLTIRTGGANDRDIVVANTDGAQWELEDCYFWQGSTHSSSNIQFGEENSEVFVRHTRSMFRFGATGQTLDIRARMDLVDCSVSAAGSAPTSLLSALGTDLRGFDVQWEGGDLSHCGSGNLVADGSSAGKGVAVFRRCKLGSGYVMLSSSAGNNSSLEVLLFDCASGDSHVAIGHQNPLGSTVVDTGIYVTADSEALSWKVTTTANASVRSPYRSPWIDRYNSDVATSIAPYIEILRDGSATAYNDNEVWGEWTAKITTGYPIATAYSDRMTPLGSAAGQAAGTGTGNWTGEGGTAWSGKVQVGSAFTPAEIGHIRGRVAVAKPSSTVYVSPRVRV